MTKPTTPLPDEQQCGEARPDEVILAELLDPCRAKNEHGWFAARHIQSQAERIAELEEEAILERNAVLDLAERAEAAETALARVMEWERGKCECCHWSDECTAQAAFQDGTCPNWTPPAAWGMEVKP